MAVLIKILPVLLFGASLFSCSSTYVRNRGNDFADIFTLEFTEGSYGVALRAGPVKIGAHYQDPDKPSYGLRGGSWGTHYTGGFTALVFGSDYFDSVPFSERMKEKTADEKKKEPSLLGNETAPENSGVTGGENEEIDRTPNLRGKTYLARSPFGTVESVEKNPSLLKNPDKSKRFKDRFAPAYYYTQLELSVGVYYGVNVGFNVGEFVDFVLGIFTIDIMGDDEPYPNRGPSIQDHPYFDYLDEGTQKKLLEQEKKGLSPMILPGGTGPP